MISIIDYYYFYVTNDKRHHLMSAKVIIFSYFLTYHALKGVKKFKLKPISSFFLQCVRTPHLTLKNWHFYGVFEVVDIYQKMKLSCKYYFLKCRK